MEFDRKMCYANNEKCETMHDGKNKTIKPRKNQNARRKGNQQILGNIRTKHDQTIGDERKNLKRVS